MSNIYDSNIPEEALEWLHKQEETLLDMWKQMRIYM